MMRRTAMAAGVMLMASWANAQTTRPAIVPAAEWNSTPQAMPEEKRHTPVRVTIHHAGELWKVSDDPMRKIKGLQTWGQRDRKWEDVPYHFLIAPDGRILEGRGTAYRPETNTRYETAGHIGVLLWGNFEVQRVSEAQLRSAVDLVAWLQQDFKLDPALLATHKDAAPGQTSCPGKDFYRYIEDGTFQRWVKEKMAGQSPEVRIKPGEGPIVGAE